MPTTTPDLPEPTQLPTPTPSARMVFALMREHFGGLRLAFTAEEVAELLPAGYGRTKVYELIRLGGLPTVPDATGSSRKMVSLTALLEWLDAGAPEPQRHQAAVTAFGLRKKGALLPAA